jgi:flagellar protein FliS
MDGAKKQVFTRRITQANKTELIVILYDMFFAYLDEAKTGYENGLRGTDESLDAIRHASLVLEHLKDDLNFRYEISGNLFSIYDFCQRELAKCIYQAKPDGLFVAEDLMKRLYGSFKEVAKADTSAPLMKNTQKVTAGLTYGRNDVSEVSLSDSSRGFYA